jgi:membrane protease YdiL (CAAX protease family)
MLFGSQWTISEGMTLAHAPGGAVGFLLKDILRLAVVFAASLVMARLERRRLADYGLPWPPTTGAVKGAVAGFATLSLLIGLLVTVGSLKVTSAAPRFAALGWAAAYALVFLLVAVLEEFRARGYAFFALTSWFGFWPAALITSAYFASSHVGNPGESTLGIINAGLAGLLFALLLQRSGNLWMPIGFHAAWDWGETYFWGVPDSGVHAPGNLLTAVPSGPVWFSGGLVGPEGSVLCSLVFIAACAGAALWMRPIRYPALEPDRHPRAPEPAPSRRRAF